jgi:O-acetylserine/cysteine efflux transporter
VSLKHSLLALLVVIIWGGNFVVIDVGQEGVPPLLFLALRFTVVCLPAVFFLKPPGIGWRQIVVIGAFLSFGQFALLYLALALGMPPGLASLLLQTQVIFSLIVAALILREKPSRRQLVGVGIGMLGLGTVIVGHSQTAPWLPLVVTLASALAWSVGNVLARRAQATSGLSLVVWSGLVVPVPALALSLIVDSPPVVWQALTNLSWVAIGSTVYTAVFASLIGYGIWNSLLTRYPTSSVVPFTLLVPVVGILAAWLVQAEVPTVTEFAGGVIMLAGLAAAVLQPRRARWVGQTIRSKQNLT